MTHNLTMTELFCGAGIGAIGFKEAGYNILWATDFNEYALGTYNLNIGNHAVKNDVTNLDSEEMPDADVITGGFPCTPFSLGGSRRGDKDEKSGNLGYHFFRLIREKMPKAFIAENVEGLTTQKHLPFFHSLIGECERMGYNTEYKVFDCWQYGVPQTRNRVFIVGIRKDLNKRFVFPDPVPVNERTTMADYIADLPFHPEGSEELGIKNHERLIRGFSSRSASVKRQRGWNEPSYTVVSNARHLPLHPTPTYDFREKTLEQIHEDEKNHIIRRLTVRECLRLQTVPDWFYFPEDNRYKKTSLLERQHERCSGIPPLVSYKLSKRLADILTDNYNDKRSYQKKLF